jgi:hypothetical protein
MSITRMETESVALRWLLGSALVVACSAPPAPAAKAPPAQGPTSDVTRFLPLLDATVFAYDTTSGQNAQKGLLVLEVRRRRPGMAELAVAGRVRRLEIDATGIRHATGGYLLKPPVQLNAQFPGDFGMVKVTAVDKTVSVPAGTFSGCLETTEDLASAEFSKRTVTAYCPNVGIVTRRTEAESNEGSAIESLELRSHGPRVDLSQPAASEP